MSGRVVEKTYYATPVISKRVQSHSKQSGDPWRDKCIALGELDTYHVIDKILDSAYFPCISHDALTTEDWSVGMHTWHLSDDFDTEVEYVRKLISDEKKKVEGDKKEVKKAKAAKDAKDAAKAARANHGAVSSERVAAFEGEHEPVSNAAASFEKENGMPPPFSLNLRSDEHKRVAKHWSDSAQAGLWRQSVLLYLLATRIKVDGSLWIGNDTFKGRIAAYGHELDNSPDAKDSNLEKLRTLVQDDYYEILCTRERNGDPKTNHALELRHEQVERALKVLSGMNRFNLARLELAARAKRWDPNDGTDYAMQFVHEGMRGCKNCTDDFAAKVIRLMLLYQAARVWTPTAEGVEFHFALGLRGGTRLGKSGMSKLLAGKRAWHTNSDDLRTQSDKNKIVEALQGKAVLEIDEGFDRSVDSKAASSFLTRKDYSNTRLAYQSTPGNYPVTGVFVMTFNENAPLRDDPALIARIIVLCPRGTKTGQYMTVDWSKIEENLPKLHEEAAFLFQEYLREKHGITSLDTQERVLGWDDDDFADYAHGLTISKEEIETRQQSQFDFTNRPAICAVIPPETVLAYFARRNFCGYANTTSAERMISKLVEVEKALNGDRNSHIYDTMKKFHSGSEQAAARYLMDHYGWQLMEIDRKQFFPPDSTKRISLRGAREMNTAREKELLASISERIEELELTNEKEEPVSLVTMTEKGTGKYFFDGDDDMFLKIHFGHKFTSEREINRTYSRPLTPPLVPTDTSSGESAEKGEAQGDSAASASAPDATDKGESATSDAPAPPPPDVKALNDVFADAALN